MSKKTATVAPATVTLTADELKALVASEVAAALASKAPARTRSTKPASTLAARSGELVAPYYIAPGSERVYKAILAALPYAEVAALAASELKIFDTRNSKKIVALEAVSREDRVTFLLNRLSKTPEFLNAVKDLDLEKYRTLSGGEFYLDVPTADEAALDALLALVSRFYTA